MADALDILGHSSEPAEPGPAPVPTRPADPLAWSSLVLGLLGPVTLGVTALPGVCCGLFSFQRGGARKLAAAGIALSLVSLVVPVLVYRQLSGPMGWSLRTAMQSEAGLRETAMGRVGLPPLPEQTTGVRFGMLRQGHGNNCWLRFDMPQDVFDAYVANLAVQRRKPLTEKGYGPILSAPQWFETAAAAHGQLIVVSARRPVRLIYDTKRQIAYGFWVEPADSGGW